jgi:hypothetical protein
MCVRITPRRIVFELSDRRDAGQRSIADVAAPIDDRPDADGRNAVVECLR